MDISLEVLLTTNIKRKKPCPKIQWLGQEKESVFVVDENRVSELRLRSGTLKKTSPRLHAAFKKSVVTLTTSANGVWLVGLHVSGELLLWNKDLDSLYTVPTNDELAQTVSDTQAHSLKLYVSDDGCRVLLVVCNGSVFLWESTEKRTAKNFVAAGRWAKIETQGSMQFPGIADKEATVHAIFIKNEVLGDCCLCTFAFYSGMDLLMTFLSLRWFEDDQTYSSSLRPYHLCWAQEYCSLATLFPACEPVKSRGALLARFSADGLILSLAMNQKDPKATQILYMNTMNFVTVSGNLRGCSSIGKAIPGRLIRSYWVGDMSWTADSLFLACILKRGSLLLMTRLGELLTLTTFGCCVEFGPAEFIPLHPLITYRPAIPIPESNDANDSLGSATSAADTMRQRYSVTCHPRLPYLLISDGYMVTALRFAKNLSSSHFMKALLLDATQRLEQARKSLQLSKPNNKRGDLTSLTGLKASLLKDDERPCTALSFIPSFLQAEDETSRPDVSTLQVDDDLSDVKGSPKFYEPSDASYGRAEEGRLEFASMFDTMHASDQCAGPGGLLDDLHHIRKILLTAWTVGVTMRNLEEKDRLLHYTVSCLTHFLAVILSSKCPSLQHKSSKKTEKGSHWMVCMSVFQQCLTVLHWDVAHRRAIGHILELTSETVKLVLEHRRDLSIRGLVDCLCLIKMVSQHLNVLCNSQHKTLLSPEADTAVCLDYLKTPIFKRLNTQPKCWLVSSVCEQPPEPLNPLKTVERLAAIWRLLYDQALYQIRLSESVTVSQSRNSHSKLSFEAKAVKFMLCHLQAELQSAGQHLDQTLHLMPVSGEERFLLGSYKEAVESWRRMLREISTRGGRRAGLLQTRYCLALLYSHLYKYNLNDAQGMCDQLVRALLRRSGLLPDDVQDARESSEIEWQLLQDVFPEAALAVIQSMGRFMAAYFTNRLLYVFPPHNVCVLPPLHVIADRLPRVVELQHTLVVGAVRDQNLSSVWTVEYALDLLLIGGLEPEAAWLANQLGDWKMSVTMGVAYNLYQESLLERVKKPPSLPLCLTPAHTFQEKLQFFLGRPPGPEKSKDPSGEKHFTDPIEEEDADVLFGSLQEMLKAAVMANAEIVTHTLQQLMESAKEITRKLSGLVPERLYLPAPPLYCPQPTSISEEDPSDFLLESEKSCRQKLSGVLQRILLLLRAARCSLPAAQWYIKQLKRTRKIMQKIREKAFLPPLSPLSETLLNYSNSRATFFKPGVTSDLVSSSVAGCFRELCALCWMLHVREKLSYCCRQYQKARDNGKLFKSADECDPCVTERCFEALDWACRMLPFTQVTYCEELIQDIILSLVSELPPVKKVAEILVRAFPHPDVVRVSLREKYRTIQQRLRHSTVKGPRGEEMLAVVIHNVQKVHIKAVRRIQRNIGPVEMHLWDSALGETLDEESLCYDKFSLGTSLSRSTLTDFRSSQVHSDVNTLSETLMTKDTNERTGDDVMPSLRDIRSVNGTPRQKRDTFPESEHLLPTVGTWEFERDDEEYTTFLELFLSYVLEKDLLHHSEPGTPFLTTFVHQLREQELNSLAFDVHTTLKRKLGKARIQSVFRAGSCYNLNPDPCKDCICTENAAHQSTGAPVLSLDEPLTLVMAKPAVAFYKSLTAKNRNPARSGLFGLNGQKSIACKEGSGNLSSKDLPCTHDVCRYKVIQTRSCLPSEELGVELQAKFSNEAKLVEWMIRWSDRRLFWAAGRSEACQAQSTAIRAKTSSAAILTSIWLLEKPYMGCIQRDNPRSKVPLTEYIVAPVSQVKFEPVVQSEHRPDAGDAAFERSFAAGDEHVRTRESWSEGSGESPRVHHSLPGKDKSVDSCGSLETASDVTIEPVKIPSETEDDQEEQPDTERISGICVSIRSVSQQMEKTATECSPDSPVPAELLIQENVELEKNSDTDISAHVVNPAIHPSPTPMSAMPNAATCTNPQDPHPEQSSQPVNPSEAVRQLFQDEMFKLLQLQQINFMSLMQVVGSSFAALPVLQNVLQQSAQGVRNQALNFTEVQASYLCQSPVPTDRGHGTAPQNTDIQANTGADHTSAKAATGREHDASHRESDEENAAQDHSQDHSQSLPGLKISLNHKKGAVNLAMPGSAPAPSLPLITASPGPEKTPLIPAMKVLNDTSGFPLLKLHPPPQFIPLNVSPYHFTPSKDPPPPREAWAPSQTGKIARIPRKTKPAYDESLTKDGAKVLRKGDDGKMWAEARTKRLLAHPNADRDSLQAGVPTQVQHKDLRERGRNPQSVSLGGSSNNAEGIPLLHLQAQPTWRPPMLDAFSKGPTMPTPAKAAAFTAFPPTLTLLKTRLPQHVQNLPIAPSPQLLPLQTLLTYDRGRTSKGPHGASDSTLQLLKANIQRFEETTKREDDINASEDLLNKGDSIKRQKRRTKQDKSNAPEKKVSVSFRPEDSIINNFDDIEPPENLDKDSGLEEVTAFVIPPGTFESVLLDIPDHRSPSVAELHYLAATQKNAPEIRDAGTNTDSGSRLADMPPQLPPELFLNLGFHYNKPEAKEDPEPDLPHVHVGHHYLSVIDIEVEDFSKNSSGGAAPAVPSLTRHDGANSMSGKPDLPAGPSSVELAHMAASVSHAMYPGRSSPARGSSITSIPMKRDSSEVKAPTEADPLTYKILSEDSAHVPSTDPKTRASPVKMPKEDPAVSRLQEMDFQLAALQDMADSMERDFANTELLVNTIDNLAAAADPEEKDNGVSENGFAVEGLEEMELLAEEEVEFQLPISITVTPRPVVSFSQGRTALRSQPPAGPAERAHVDKSPLDVTGLSDIADILNDLMEGGVSAKELGLTESQALTLSRAKPRNVSSRPSSKRSQAERRELQLWMKKQQRERLAQHRRKMEELRELEHNPYTPSHNANVSLTTKVIQRNQSAKDEKDRRRLSEHHSARVSDAMSLMQEMLSESMQIPASNPRAGSGVSGATGAAAQRSPSLKRSSVGRFGSSVTHVEKRRSLARSSFSPPKPRSAPPRSAAQGSSTFVLSKSPVDPRAKARRMPTYPVRVKFDASLPGDRMSQITRRGLLSGRKDHNQTHLNPAAPRHDLKRSNVRHNQTEQEFEDLERDVVSPWEVPDEINRILNSHRSALPPQRSLLNGEEAFHASKLDNSSESTGSILSKLDWNAIEDMVASMDNT